MKKAVLFIFFGIAFSLTAQVTLNPCISNTDFTVVVLGSSTAAGTGPSHPDSTWVNKYRKTLQNINPNNQVINLAVGGYTTYRIMPDSFVTPPNRPAVNFQHNIDEALSYSPDAIIVNLPSNDRQWPMQEQLSNFDTLFHYSLNRGVPFYVCTTQPIAQLNSAPYQKAVADSILNTFGSFAIDIFTPLADTNNAVNSAYAADAVHLNDAGHVIIHNQIVNHDILIDIYSVPTGEDIALKTLFIDSEVCTDSNAQVGVVFANLGDTIQNGVPIVLNVNGIIYNATYTNPLPSCTEDTVFFSVNLDKDTTYFLQAIVALPADSNVTNDTASLEVILYKSPEIIPFNDTNCFGDIVNFSTQLIEGDTILYYRSFNDTLPVSNILPFALTQDTLLYAQGVTGELTYAEQLTTQESGNINFNGNMFDLLPKTDLTLKSIEIKPNQIGSNSIMVYTINSSYKGYEQNAAAWTLIKQDTVFVSSAQEWTTIDLNLSLLANDTIGFYIQMANSSQTLNYRSVSQAETHSTSHLDFMSGAGIGYNFGAIYFPRVLTAKFKYTHGVNLLGDCHTPRWMLTHSISQEVLSVTQNPTFTLEGDSLYADLGFSNYFWVNTSTTDTISNQRSVFVDSNQLAPNSTTVSIKCFAQDKFGCLKSDSTLITLNGYLGIEPFDLANIRVYPNPVVSVLEIENPQMLNLEIELFNSLGMRVLTDESNSDNIELSMDALPNGTYILMVQYNGARTFQKLILQD